MDKERLDQLIEIANKQEPLDLTHVEEARFVRDLDVPAVVLLWRSSHGEVRHWFAKYPAELIIASDGGITTSATAFWVVQPEGGFKIVDTPNGPRTEEYIENLRPDGKRSAGANALR